MSKKKKTLFTFVKNYFMLYFSDSTNHIFPVKYYFCTFRILDETSWCVRITNLTQSKKFWFACAQKCYRNSSQKERAGMCVIELWIADQTLNSKPEKRKGSHWLSSKRCTELKKRSFKLLRLRSSL